MKIVLFAFVSLLLSSSGKMDDIRNSFQEANKNKENAVSFNEMILKNTLLNKGLYFAYLGASETLLAKFGSTSGERLKFFNSGKSNLEKAVLNQPNNIEIRMIRFIIQNNTPPILKYNNDIEKDKAFILDHFESAPEDVKRFIRKAAQNTTQFTPEELTKIK